MSSSVADAKADVYALLNGTVTGVTETYDHLPPLANLNGPVCLCVYTAGVTADFWLIAVRLFVEQGVDPKLAQDTLDLLMPSVDAKAGPFGPLAWIVDGASEDSPYWSATCVYEVGREDYY